MAQLMPLPLTVSCFSKIQTGFTFLVPAHLGSPGKGPLNGCVNGVCVFFILLLGITFCCFCVRCGRGCYLHSSHVPIFLYPRAD